MKVCLAINMNWSCQPTDYSNSPQALRMLTLFWYTLLIKLMEFAETFFFILRKKYNQVTKLHVYHHWSTFLWIWLVTKYIGGGSASLFIILNSFVHVIMYTYYFLASFGPKFQKKLTWWKSKLTMIQMVLDSISQIDYSLSEIFPFKDIQIFKFKTFHFLISIF